MNFTRKIPVISLALALSIQFSFSAMAATSLEIKTNFDQHVQSIVMGKNLAALTEELAKAKANLQAFKASKDVKSVNENKWKLTREMEQQLLSLHLQAAEKAMSMKQHQQSQAFLKDASELQPGLPITAYYQGLNYLNMGKTWDATRAFYTAKRLNAYPAQRKMVNPVKPWEVLSAQPERLEAAVDTELKKLGKDTDYPITLNFATGKNTPLKLVPGVGAHIQGSDGDFNLYLEKDMLKKVLDNIGKAENIQEQNMRGQVLRFHTFGNLVVGVNPENKIERIQISNPGYQAEVNGKLLGIGDTESTIFNMLGKEHGFEKMASADPRFKHVIAYNDYGVSFGITPQNTVGVLSIWTLE